MKGFVIAAVLTVACGAAPAYAATLTQDFTANDLSFFGPNLSLFDASLGTLQQVQISGSAVYAPKLFFFSGPPGFPGQGGPYNYSVKFSTDFSGTPFFVHDLPTATQTIVSDVVFSSLGIHTVIPKFSFDFDTSFTSAADLAGFYGTGTSQAGVKFNDAKADTTILSSENTFLTIVNIPFDITKNIHGKVTYFYTPARSAVPEPATWAMFVGGFGLMGAVLRRRKVVGGVASAA